MVVRILWNRGRTDNGAQLRSLTFALAALLTPSALVAFTIFFWSITAELHLTTNFFVPTGLFSHWQVWLVAAAVLLLAARLLNRYAMRENRVTR
jgi:hypothetical protein